MTENVTLSNSGLAALENVRLSLKNLDGLSAPDWLHLGILPTVGDIEVGEKRDVPITFSPGQDIAPGAYQFILQVESDNNPTTPIYLLSATYCWTATYGICGSTGSSSGGGGGGGGGGTWGVSTGSSSGTVSSPAPLPQKLSGAKCMGKPNTKPAPCLKCELLNALKPIKVGSVVDTRLREYSRDIKDMTVPIPGGELSVHRYYELGRWFWEFERDNLSFDSNSLGEVEKVVKNGVTYDPTGGDTKIFSYLDERIEVTENGYRWSDKAGDWKTYDSDGLLLAYGKRDDTIATVLYQDGHCSGWADRNGNQVIWYTFENGHPISASDAGGRTITYTYQGDLLHTVTNLRGFTSSYDYTNGRLTRAADPGGKVRTIAYNVYGDVISVTDEKGGKYTFEYDYDKATRQYYSYAKFPDGKVRENWYNDDGDPVRMDINGVTVKSVKYGDRVRWVTDERGYVTRYDLDEWDNPVYILYPDNTWVKKTYNHPWNLLTSVNRMGVITEYEYDASGRRTAMIEAKGTAVERRTEYTYTESGRLASSTRVGGNGEQDAVTRFTYDDNDRLQTITDPEGRVTTFSDYDAGTNPQTVTDGRGMKKHFTYDAAGNLLTVRDNDNQLTSKYGYDEAGNRNSVINAYLKEYKFTYDSERNLIGSVDPLGNSAVRTYNSAGKPTTVTDRESNTTTYTYDSFERVSKVTDPAGNAISYTYADPSTGCSSCSGGIDLATAITYPTFTRKMSYDSRKRLVSQTDVYGNQQRETTYGYDQLGRLETVTDPEGNITTYGYDELGRKISETDAQHNVTHYYYDSRDNLVRLEDANSRSTYFSYDLSDRLVKETKPLSQQINYTYDKAGNLASTTDADGHKTVYIYDGSNRLVQSKIYAAASDAQPAKTVTYSYNLTGSLTGYDDGVTSGHYSYDVLQRRTGETVDYGAFSLYDGYTYTPDGRKNTYTDPAGRVRTYKYDPAGKPLAVDLGAAGQVSYNSYSWNRPDRITLPGGATLNFHYDGLQQVTGITTKDPASNPVIDYGYTYTLGGNVNSKTTEHGDYTYSYDTLQRLTGVQGPDNQESYLYDPLGNRTSSKTSANWQYNANNQLTGYDTTTFAYDNQGNMVKKTMAGVTTNFSWDADNLLAKISDRDGATIATYYYDPFGRRLWKEVGGVKTYFHYNDEGLAGEYDAAGNELRTYGYQPGSPWSTNPLFVEINGEYYWYQNDHLGTPQKIIAANGTVVWAAGQDAFGNATVEVEQIVNNLRFPGQYFDQESGLHYNWHRFYDPETGRYVSADPIGLNGGINLYSYVEGDPANFNDPERLFMIF